MNHAVNLIRTIIGIIGNVTSFCLFFSPAPTFWRIWKNKSVEDFHPYPYLAGVLNCYFWVFYAFPSVHPHSTLIMTINSIGLALELSYLAIFFYYSKSKKQRWIVVLGLLAEAIFATGVSVITMEVFHTTKRRTTFVGIICVIFGIILYGSPLSIMKKVIQTKSVEYMPFWICMAGFANGIVWAVYALLPFDPYVLTGNGVGALLGFSQLCLHVVYRKTTPKRGDAQKPGKESEVQLQTVAANRMAV